MGVKKDVEKLKELTKKLKEKAKQIHKIQAKINNFVSWMDLDDTFVFFIKEGIVYIETFDKYGDSDDTQNFNFAVGLFDMTEPQLEDYFKEDLERVKKDREEYEREHDAKAKIIREENDIKEFKRLKRKFKGVDV